MGVIQLIILFSIENFIAVSFLRPVTRPDATVIPLLDIPGNNEKICEIPINTESDIEGFFFLGFAYFVEKA